MSFLSSYKAKVFATVLVAVSLVYLAFYLINEYQLTSEQDESYKEFLRSGEAADDFLLNAKQVDMDAEARSELLFETDKQLMQEIKEMDARLGITEEKFSQDYPGIGE